MHAAGKYLCVPPSVLMHCCCVNAGDDSYATVYSPLASGVLTGQYNSDIPESSRFTVEQ
jgi:hypothetical protein